MRLGKLLALLLLLLPGTAVIADQSRQYFGVVGSDAQFDPDKGKTEDLGDLRVKLGYVVNRFVGVELHMGGAVSGDNDTSSDQKLGYVAPLLRATLPFNRVNLYGLLGLASVRGEFAGDYDDHYSDIAFGAGIELYGTRNTALTFEYMRYGIDDIYKTMGVGIVHYFEWPRLYNARIGR
jgi:hypothetical protein